MKIETRKNHEIEINVDMGNSACPIKYRLLDQDDDLGYMWQSTPFQRADADDADHALELVDAWLG